jgi:hypothetical protein
MNAANKISIFKSYRDTTPMDAITIEQFCIDTVRGRYAESVNAVRKLTDKVERDRIKSTLPAVTISGVFSARKSNALTQHSGLVCIDFDGKTNPHVDDWNVVRDWVAKIPAVLFAALSVSARGMFCIMPIAYPERHADQFNMIVSGFANLGLMADRTPDVSRLRGVSFDPNGLYNPRAVDYKGLPKPKTTFPDSYHHRSDGVIPSVDKLKSWVDGRQSFVSGNRNIYIAEYAAACHRVGIPESDSVHGLAMYASDDFTAEEIERTVSSIYRNASWKK